MQRMLEQLTAVHGPDRWTREKAMRLGSTMTMAEHPVVVTHPITGRKGLFVNPDYTLSINELSRLESDALLSFLFKLTVRPEHSVRYRWTEPSVALWDNHGVWHRRVYDCDPLEERIYRRAMTRGPVPVAAAH
jgi:taurine dioxygenase